MKKMKELLNGLKRTFWIILGLPLVPTFVMYPQLRDEFSFIGIWTMFFVFGIVYLVMYKLFEG